MLNNREKSKVLKSRFEKTQAKGKHTLKTTLINTTPKQMRIIAALISQEFTSLEFVTRGNHQLVTISRTPKPKKQLGIKINGEAVGEK